MTADTKAKVFKSFRAGRSVADLAIVFDLEFHQIEKVLRDKCKTLDEKREPAKGLLIG